VLDSILFYVTISYELIEQLSTAIDDRNSFESGYYLYSMFPISDGIDISLIYSIAGFCS